MASTGTPGNPATGPITVTAAITASLTSVTLGSSSSIVIPAPFSGHPYNFAMFGNTSGSVYFAAGAGPGGGPHVKVYDATSGQLVSSFFAYNAGFGGGVEVAGGATDSIVTGTGAGGGPHVRVLNFASVPQLEFFAYNAGFTGGVRVASADVNGDGKADIVTGPGPGGGPHGGSSTAITGLSSRVRSVASSPSLRPSAAASTSARVCWTATRMPTSWSAPAPAAPPARRSARSSPSCPGSTAACASAWLPGGSLPVRRLRASARDHAASVLGVYADGNVDRAREPPRRRSSVMVSVRRVQRTAAWILRLRANSPILRLRANSPCQLSDSKTPCQLSLRLRANSPPGVGG